MFNRTCEVSKPTLRSMFCLRDGTDQLFSDCRKRFEQIPKHRLDITPWTLSAPTVRFDLTKLKKDTANPETYKQFCLHLITEYPLSETIFNDVSKTEGVAAATVSTKRSRKPFTCLPDDSSIYTAELRAILMTLKHAYCSTRRSFVMLSDSLSSLLQPIVNLKYDHPALVQIVEF